MFNNDINLYLKVISPFILILASCSAQQATDIGQGFISESLYAPWHGKTDKTRFCCHSTADCFYFSFEVEDSTLFVSDNPESERVVDNEDRAEIFFSSDRSLKKTYYCAEIDAAGRIMDYKADYYRKLDFDWNFSTMAADAIITPWGYRIAGSISLEELMSLGIEIDKSFYLGVYRGDRIEDGSFEWYSLIPNDAKEPDFHSPGVTFECKLTQKKERLGVVVYPDDVTSLGLDEWEKRIDLSGIDVIGLHAATSNDPIDTLETFVCSKIGQDFLALCSSKGVDVEYELHSLEYLLPRELFGSHPEYFRMSEDGERCSQYNMCFTSDEAIESMRPQLEKLLAWVKPTTHRYYFWADDKQGMFCNCDNCRKLLPSEQILYYENHLLKMLREYDAEATLAHLAYQQTLDSPMNLRADSGIFLEFAPIKRDYELPLSVEQISSLKDNLMAFPPHTQHILEYWLDESMFCHWKKDTPVLLPFSEEQAERDFATYRSLGATDFTCFATWLNAGYCDEFGSTDVIFSSYGTSFKK